MTTAAEIIVKLLADTTGFKANMAEAAATVKTSQDAMAASMQSSMASFRDFENIQKGSIKTTEDLAAAQATLNAVRDSGAFTTEEIAAKEALVAAAMTNVGKETQAASGILGAFTRNSRTMYSTSALITDAMTGQFSRMRREVAALGNETGVMASAFRFAVSPVGILAAGLAGLAVAAINANEAFEELQRSIIESGNFAGVTGDQMAVMAQRMANSGQDIGTAAEAIKALVASGQVSHDALETASRGVVDLAAVTGDKLSKAVSIFVELGRSPVQAVAKLNESMSFLTEAEFNHIDALEKEGKTAEAGAAAQAALANAMHGRAVAMAGYASGPEKAWKAAWATISGHGEIQESQAMQAAQTRVKAISQELEFLAAHGNREKNTLATGGLSAQPVTQAYIAQLKAERANLEATLSTVNSTAAKEAAAAAKVRDYIQHILHPGHKGAGGSGSADEQAFLQAQFTAQQQGHEMSLSEQKAWWQKRLEVDQAGGATDATATANAMRHVVEIQRQMDRQSEASGREAARKRAEAAQQEAHKEEQAARKAAREKLALDEQQVESAHQIATAKVANTLEADKLQAASGKITAAQMVQDQMRALQEQLAADVRYFQAKAKLAAGDAAEQAKWNAAIVVDQLKTQQAMLKIQEDYRKAMQRIGDEITNRKVESDRLMIDSGFREVNALVAGQETLRQAVFNVAAQIIQTQEDNIAKGIALAMAGEQGKTAAVEMGTAERLALNMAAEARSLAIQGEAAVKWIMTEAAKAAAGAFSAMASIPYVGPFLAVGASVAAFAEVAKLVGSVASAEGGWERVPVDGMTTVLHKDEMVLPKHVADPVRNMARRGGSGGGDNFTVYAQDARGLADFIRRHGGTLGDSLRRMGRNGYTF